MDKSPEMLALAPRCERVSYTQGVAELIPFRNGAFDLATVCSGIHWFHEEALSELHRVLREEGTLVIYDVWFPAEMEDEPRFAEWMSATCAPRYPSIPKNYNNVEALQSMGFRQTWAAEPRFNVVMSLGSLVDYLMTHSERITAIRERRETEGEQAAFFEEGLRFLFSRKGEREVVFGIWVRSFERQPPES